MEVVLAYLQPFWRNSLLKCVWKPKITKKLTKIPYFGDSRSSMLTKLRSSSPALVTISSMSLPICNHFEARQANSGKITSFRKGYLSFSRSFHHSKGSASPSSMKFCHEIPETVKTQSLYLT